MRIVLGSAKKIGGVLNNQIDLVSVATTPGSVTQVIQKFGCGRKSYIAGLTYQAFKQGGTVIMIDAINSNEMVQESYAHECLWSPVFESESSVTCHLLKNELEKAELAKLLMPNSATYIGLDHSNYFSARGRDTLALAIQDIAYAIEAQPEVGAKLLIVVNGIYDYGKASLELRACVDILIKKVKASNATIIFSDSDIYEGRNVVSEDYKPSQDYLIYRNTQEPKEGFSIAGHPVEKLNMGEAVIFTKPEGAMNGVSFFKKFDSEKCTSEMRSGGEIRIA